MSWRPRQRRQLIIEPFLQVGVIVAVLVRVGLFFIDIVLPSWGTFLRWWRETGWGVRMAILASLGPPLPLFPQALEGRMPGT